jgi:hypothetical protein
MDLPWDPVSRAGWIVTDWRATSFGFPKRRNRVNQS